MTDVAQLQRDRRRGRVDDDVEGVGAGAVAREVADRALLAAVAVAVDADDFAVVAGLFWLLPTPIGVIPGGLEQLAGAAADHRHVLDLLGGEARALSPESTGAISGRDVTEITSSTPPTFSVMPVTVRRCPSSITMSEASRAVKPASSTRTP